LGTYRPRAPASRGARTGGAGRLALWVPRTVRTQYAYQPRTRTGYVRVPRTVAPQVASLPGIQRRLASICELKEIDDESYVRCSDAYPCSAA
jgi:hypothetical protein